MPIYEYNCEKCDCNFEILTSVGEEKHVTCPKCGTNEVKRQLSVSCIGGSGLSRCATGGSGGFS